MSIKSKLAFEYNIDIEYKLASLRRKQKSVTIFCASNNAPPVTKVRL